MGFHFRNFLQGGEVSVFATRHERLSHRLQLLPAFANAPGFLGGDGIVAGGSGHHGQQVGKFLHDLVRRRDQVVRMGVGDFGVFDEETAAPLAEPMEDAQIPGGLE